MNDQEWDEKIMKITEIIYDLEVNDNYSQGDDLQMLRHVVMFIHLKIEQLIESMLIGHITDWKRKPYDVIQAALYIVRTEPIFNRMEYYNKADAAREMKLINDETFGKIMKVNDLRKWFSHPKAYHKQIKELDNKESIYKTLENLLKTFTEVRKVELENMISEKHEKVVEVVLDNILGKNKNG